MAHNSAPEIRISVGDSLSSAAAAEMLNAETRAFGNAVAKMNLQHATAAFEQAKESLPAESVQTAEGNR